MRIIRFSIQNYKSFRSTQAIELGNGYNIIVGQNNVGKTALVEALSLNFHDAPHRSLITVPTSEDILHPSSHVGVEFEFSKSELESLLKNDIDSIYLPMEKNSIIDSDREFSLLYSTNDLFNLEVLFSNQGQPFTSSLNGLSPTFTITGDYMPAIKLNIDRYSGSISVDQNASYNVQDDDILFSKLAKALRSRIYTFRAERNALYESGFQSGDILAPDASNLASVLNVMQGNSARFSLFNRCVQTIIPQVKWISVKPTLQGNVEILVWTVPPDTEREDLAFSLADSGTGIGQVLAILYVVITSAYPRTIIIDEPQSFLHPGAIRKLFGVLTELQATRHQHQYIVTTHSPTVVTAAEPARLFLVHKGSGQREAESLIEPIAVGETEQLQLFLSEIGARLADVFGPDNILWVEGPTEERCFPLIVEKIAQRQLLGTAILGVRSTGELEGNQAKAAFDIYRRLSRGGGLLPPAIGFLLDGEGRTAKQQADLIRESKGVMAFLPRRMYENYLLNPEAIAAVMKTIPDFSGESCAPVTGTQVQDWIDQHRWDTAFIPPSPSAEPSDERWLRDVHGAKMLARLFRDLSSGRFLYEKVEHGFMLTQWIAEHHPEELREVNDLILSKIQK